MNVRSRADRNVKEVVPFPRVSGMKRSVRYYVEGLGLTMKNKWVDGGKLRWCWLAVGGAALMLQEFPKEGHDAAALEEPLRRGEGVVPPAARSGVACSYLRASRSLEFPAA